jgi:hypothetical protein
MLLNPKNNPKAWICVLTLLAFPRVFADEVQIVSADFRQASDGTWSVDVGLLHEDSGWDHYADIWRVLDEQGRILGERVLLHPHENEQPFVRGTNGLVIPEDAILYVVAHDSVHGWSRNRLEVDLSKAEDGRLIISEHD